MTANEKAIEAIANAVLYEGYMLYPYRSSAIKNRQRWNFGVLYPESGSGKGDAIGPHFMQTECLVRGSEASSIDVAVRFLQLNPVHKTNGTVGPSRGSAQEVWERRTTLPRCYISALVTERAEQDFSFPGELRCRVTASVTPCDRGLFKLTVRVTNVTFADNLRETVSEQALVECLLSTHTILRVADGEFVSMTDPPADAIDAAATCRSTGTWPVLVGDEGSHDAILSSPIILYDYPQVAPESSGDLFDSTEIDEILALRILTLSDDEKREIREGDERARAVLERTESLPAEHFLKLHGVLRNMRPHSENVDTSEGDRQ